MAKELLKQDYKKFLIVLKSQFYNIHLLNTDKLFLIMAGLGLLYSKPLIKETSLL